MLLKEKLQANALFDDPEWEERFRIALDRERGRNAPGGGSFREIWVSDFGPEEVAAVLASLWSQVPVLLGSGSWGRWTRDALETMRKFPVAPGTVLIRTGGSSGTPKFAIHSWDSLQAAGLNLWKRLGNQPLSAGLNLPLYHVSGWMPVMRALVSGGRVSANGSSARDLPGLFLNSVVPTTLYRAMEDPEKLDALRRADIIFAGGAAFSEELLERAREERLPLSLVYGMTETAAMVAMQDPGDFLEGSLSAVKALPGNKISIGEDEEIFVESDQLFLGYLGSERRESRLWATGDRGGLDGRGNLTVFGRKGRFISSGGETVSLRRVEQVAEGLPGVSSAFAMPEVDSEWGERIILFVAVGSSRNRDWRGELKQVLDPAEVPAEVRAVTEIPRNEAGKVDPDRLFG